MLELRNVTKRFLGIAAVDAVSFLARAGEVTGYLGPNGSGKSTTMKMITGLIETHRRAKSCSRASASRRDLDRLQAAHGLRAGGTASLCASHGPGIPDHGRPAARPVRPTRTPERIDGLLRLFCLHGDRHVPISSYSKGMRQKILLSAALLHNPDLILLDEPFSGLDVGSALVMRSLIQELAARGKVVLFSSHELETVERVCSHVVILHRGEDRRRRFHRSACAR